MYLFLFKDAYYVVGVLLVRFLNLLYTFEFVAFMLSENRAFGTYFDHVHHADHVEHFLMQQADIRLLFIKFDLLRHGLLSLLV
jgi:hypothetical protein